MAIKTSKRRSVKFEITSMEAESVFLVGDFNGWNEKKHPMKQNGRGIWRKTVMVAPGTYEYKFMVDGRWESDPKNENYSINCYGTRNSLIQIS
jgi:1,4-alpha-glucan branching enzyme